jgi:hypothetical protein
MVGARQYGIICVSVDTPAAERQRSNAITGLLLIDLFISEE